MLTSTSTGTDIARGFGAGLDPKWPLQRSSEIFELRYGKALVASRRRSGGIPVFGTNGQTGWHDTALFSGPGVIIGRKGAGHLGVHWSDTDFWVIDTAYSLVPSDGVDLRFAYYLVKFVGLNHLKDGTSNPSLTRDAFGSQYFPIPPIGEQRAIAETLSALDDKIESNLRIVNQAQAVARAYVKRAIDNCDYVPYGEAIGVRMGSAFKGDNFSAPGVGRPLLRIRDLKTFTSQVWTTEDRPDETVIRPGDIVVGMDAEFRATLWLGEDAVLNQRVCSFRGKDGVGRAFVLAALEPQLASQERSKTGTTVIHLNKADIETFTVPSLTTVQHRKLSAVTEPLLEVAVARASQARLISDLRDALLPELLSGRVRVPIREVVPV